MELTCYASQQIKNIQTRNIFFRVFIFRVNSGPKRMWGKALSGYEKQRNKIT